MGFAHVNIALRLRELTRKILLVGASMLTIACSDTAIGEATSNIQIDAGWDVNEPNPDKDGDGIPNTADNCPTRPETFNNFLDDDGCPDDPNDTVHISRDHIIITSPIYFDAGRTTIKPESFLILDGVAKSLRDNPQLTKVRIEAHTDDRGAAEANLALSQGRAEVVLKYLSDKNVDQGRLEAVGYGETRPIRENSTSEGREFNRRVEFVILDVQNQ